MAGSDAIRSGFEDFPKAPRGAVVQPRRARTAAAREATAKGDAFAQMLVLEGELRAALGDGVYEELSIQARIDLVQKVRAVRGWWAWQHVNGIRRGGKSAARAAYCAAVSAGFARRVSERTLYRWCLKYHDGGPAALLGSRGRPRGSGFTPSEAAVLYFSRLRAGGANIAAADRATRSESRRRGWRWPRSVWTVRRWLREGVVRMQRDDGIAPKRAARGGDQHGYLRLGEGANN